MKDFSYVDALRGMRIWKNKINCNNHYLILVIPEYESKLILDLIPSLTSYLALENRLYEKIEIIYVDDDVKSFLSNKLLNFIFIKVSKQEMKNLVCYMLLTAKHYGVMRCQNVKLVSFDVLYGNQLQIIAENNLYPPRYLITKMILNRI